jgi:glycosyltransferase involved in cell wall biosynthesis
MMESMRVLVIIPAWNESGSIATVIQDVRSNVPSADILVIDDASSDSTVEVARKAGARVVRLPCNLGVGGARRAGYLYARRNGYDAVVQVDADGQHDARYIPELIHKLGDADIVIGARFGGVGEYRVRGPRAWAMRFLSAVLSRVARSRLTDTTSGFRACNATIIELYSRWYPAEYLGDTIETIVRSARLGHRIVQIPVAMRERMAGVPSHSPLKATVYLLNAMLVLILSLIRR